MLWNNEFTHFTFTLVSNSQIWQQSTSDAAFETMKYVSDAAEESHLKSTFYHLWFWRSWYSWQLDVYTSLITFNIQKSDYCNQIYKPKNKLNKNNNMQAISYKDNNNIFIKVVVVYFWHPHPALVPWCTRTPYRYSININIKI